MQQLGPVWTAKLFLGRELRTRLSLMKPDIDSRVASKQSEMKFHHDQHARTHEFMVGDTVLAHDYRSSGKWQPATLMEMSAPYSYKVQLQGSPLTWHRHADQLFSRGKPTTSAALPSGPESLQPMPSEETRGMSGTETGIEQTSPPPSEFQRTATETESAATCTPEVMLPSAEATDTIPRRSS